MATDTRVFFVWSAPRSQYTYLEWRVSEHSVVGGWLVFPGNPEPSRWHQHRTIAAMTLATYVGLHRAVQINKCKARKLIKQHGIKATI